MGEKLAIDWPLSGVMRLSLCRPERHNAVDSGLVEGLIGALDGEGRRAAAIVLGADGSFCAGMHLGLPTDVRRAVSDRLYDLYELMLEHERPIVAAASGHAIGAGAQLLLASDLRVGAPDLVVRFPGPANGLAVGTWGLPSLLGRGRALDLSLTMRSVSANEALAIGLLDRLVATPGDEALEIAGAIAKLEPDAVASTKALVIEAAGLKQALGREAARNSSAPRGHSVS